MKKISFALGMLGCVMSYAEANAQSSCFKIQGSHTSSFEQRENDHGRPGRLVSKEIRVEPISAADNTQTWCASSSGVTFEESGGTHIREFYPFNGGFVQNSYSVGSLPMTVQGIAKGSVSRFDVAWQYTLGARLTEARAAQTNSLRVEVSFSVLFNGSGCQIKNYRATSLSNSGVIGNGSLILGHYSGYRTTRSTPICQLI